ncbi:MAG: hypothetical protein HOW73_43455 [Polyangiaceae bacterium]|nr:hypothetical protein [Polyangiaceae bacterium]
MRGSHATESHPVYKKLIQEARTPRETPRTVGAIQVWEDPAPDWYWKLVGAIVRRGGHLSDDVLESICRRALAWVVVNATRADVIGAATKPPLRGVTVERMREYVATLLHVILDEQPGHARNWPQRPRVEDLRQFLNLLINNTDPTTQLGDPKFCYERPSTDDEILNTYRYAVAGISDRSGPIPRDRPGPDRNWRPAWKEWIRALTTTARNGDATKGHVYPIRSVYVQAARDAFSAGFRAGVRRDAPLHGLQQLALQHKTGIIDRARKNAIEEIAKVASNGWPKNDFEIEQFVCAIALSIEVHANEENVALKRTNEEATASVEQLTKKVEELEALFQRTHHCHWSWVAEGEKQRKRADALRAQLDAVSGPSLLTETDLAKGSVLLTPEEASATYGDAFVAAQHLSANDAIKAGHDAVARKQLELASQRIASLSSDKLALAIYGDDPEDPEDGDETKVAGVDYERLRHGARRVQRAVLAAISAPASTAEPAHVG